ncbi:MAG TPA: MFS transporter, partial [Acidimicrobiia bacterium]|nr:MFS transporter [Acidimicrobiia bacterium]
MTGRSPRRLFVDVTPLQESPQFRRLYLGMVAGFIGRQLTVVAVPYQLYVLTGSTLAVGLLGIVQLVPLLVVALAAGAVVDAMDRKKVLLVSQVLLALTALGLALNASLPDPMIWPLYVLSAANAGISTLDSPSRMAIMPSLIRADQYTAAIGLQQALNTVGQAVVPAVAGVLLARVSITAAYLAEAVAFVVAAAMVGGLPSLMPEGGGRKAGMGSVVEGLRYLKGQRLIQANFVIDLNAMIFSMPRALFPAMGTTMFGGDASTVGLLYAAPGAGALVGALTSGWVGPIKRKGRGVIIAVVAWGLSIAAFGLVRSLPFALVALAAAGAADVISALFRGTILQMTVPDELRGRLWAIHMAVVGGGPRLGDLQAGTLAAVTSIPFAVVAGGVACVLGAFGIKRFMPELWNYPEPASTDP